MKPLKFDGNEFNFEFDIGLEKIQVSHDKVQQTIHLVGAKQFNDQYEEEILSNLRASHTPDKLRRQRSQRCNLHYGSRKVNTLCSNLKPLRGWKTS